MCAIMNCELKINYKFYFKQKISMVEAKPAETYLTGQNLVDQKKIAEGLTFGENDVGIELFFSDTDANKSEGANSLVTLNCAFKHRFSDFIVNEIDQEGEVVWFRAEEDLQKWKVVNMEPVV